MNNLSGTNNVVTQSSGTKWLALLVDSDTGFEKSSSGRWAEDEHERFLEAYNMFGNDWKKVSAFVKTRSIPQVRLEQIHLLFVSYCIG